MLRAGLCLLLALPAAAVPETGTSLLVVGLDAADWAIAEPLMRAGRMPHLARLTARGVRGELASFPVRSPNRSNSAAIWTTIATGKSPERHGVTDFAVRRPDGGWRLFTSSDRRVKAFWNALSERGLRVGVVGWWATWPAEAVNGEMVSGEFWPTRRASGDACRGCVEGSRPDADIPGATWPPSLGEELAGLRVFEADLASAPAAAVHHGAWGAADYWPYARDSTMAMVAERLLSTRRYDAFAVHLQSLDIVSHLAWVCRPGPRFLAYCPRFDRFSGRVDRYYEFVDGLLGRLLAAAGEGATTLVVSDHGYGTYDDLRELELRAGRMLGEMSPEERARLGADREASSGHTDRALVAAAGPRVRRGRPIAGAVADLGATILALAGAPPARDMDGKVLSFVRPAPAAAIESYESPASTRSVPATRPGEAEVLDRLKALGYLAD
jgi:hypothetical protein